VGIRNAEGGKKRRKSDFKSKIPNPDVPEPKEKLITKARKYENTKKKEIKFRGEKVFS
jgi:hypothetical protein